MLTLHIYAPVSMLVWQFRSHQPSVLPRQRQSGPQLSAMDRRADLALAQPMAELVELISDLRALKGLHRAEIVEQARVVDGRVIPTRHRLRTVEARHPVALEIMRMNV
jgi:hypothetical protein